MFAGEGAFEPALLGAAEAFADPKKESKSSATAPVHQSYNWFKSCGKQPYRHENRLLGLDAAKQDSLWLRHTHQSAQRWSW